MPWKNNTDLWSIGIAFAAASLGALARWWNAREFQENFHIVPFLVDLGISAGAGVLIFFVVVDMGQSESIGALCSAVTGNIGCRIFDVLSPLVFRGIPSASKKLDAQNQNKEVGK